MNKTAMRAGYWSAIIAIVAFVAYIICFIAILIMEPVFIWTNMENYLSTVQTSNQFFKHIAMAFMIVFGVCYVIQLCSIEEIADASRKYYALLAELFGTGFIVLISINYFLQIGAVRLQINAGQTNGLEQFVQGNPLSVTSAINMLGWTVFFGLSCLFVAFALGNTRREKIIKYAFLANGWMMLVSAIAYILDIKIILILTMYLGMGAAILTAEIALCKLFKDLQY